MKKISCFLVLFFIFTVLGCATMSDVIQQKESGTSRVYPINADRAWEIAKGILRSEGSDQIEEHRKEGYMLTSAHNPMTQQVGTAIGVWVESADPKSSKVTIVTKRKYALSLFTALTETTFHDKFAQIVSMERR